MNLEGRQASLSALPLLSGASCEFLKLMASLVTPQLMLPGQVIDQGSQEQPVADARLFILLGGYCHKIAGDAIIGTISQNMVFGELEVFGLRALSQDVQVRTQELCSVGSITHQELFTALSRHPEERCRFEGLVHARL